MCSMVNRQSKRFSFSLRIRIVGTFSLVPLRNPSALPMMEPKVCCPTRMEFDVTERRFPPPWSVEELDACFVRPASKEARRIASNIAKLPELLQEPHKKRRDPSWDSRAVLLFLGLPSLSP